MFRRRILPALLGSVVLASLAAAEHKTKEEDGPAAQLSKAPVAARSLRNPFAADENAAAAGHKLYEKHCAHCHGADAGGLERAANLRSRAIQEAPPGSLFWALRNGRIRKGMPSWSKLPDQQLWQLVTYIDSLNKGR